MPRVIAVAVAIVLAACALTPNQAPVQPDYPSTYRDAGRG